MASPTPPESAREPRRPRLVTWLVVLMVVTLGAVLIPGLWVTREAFERTLVASEVERLQTSERVRVERLAARLTAAEESIARFASAIQDNGDTVYVEATVESFDALVAQDIDGCWRSRPVDDEDPGAAIWFPAGKPPDDDQKRLLMVLKRFTDVHGLGGLEDFENTWALPEGGTGGEVILWPSNPEFIYDMTEGDYLQTEWVTLTRPENNDDGAPRWTRPTFDDESRLWMISVVMPLQLDGQWAGALGHDLPLGVLARRLLTDAREGLEPHLISPEGRLLASPTYAGGIKASGGELSVGYLEEDPLLERAFEATRTRSEALLDADQERIALAYQVPDHDWVVVSTIPRSAILAGVREAYGDLWPILAALVVLTAVLPMLVLLRAIYTTGRRLVRGASKVAGGDHSHRFAGERFAETQTMAQALNGMLDHIAENEERLRQSQKMEAVGQLAGGIAHDFNNLLTAMMGYADRLLQRLPAETVEHHDAQEILRAGERAASLTQQLLLFGRRKELRPEVIDINALLSGSARLLHRLIGEDVELVLDPCAGPLPTEVDPTQMEQVLMNLVLNARDAVDSRGHVRVTTAVTELTDDPGGLPDGGYVAVAVADDGPGIPADVLEHIFEPFFTTKAPGEGTGLGLSTVHGIVRGSGGDVRVASAPGTGTTFSVLLPRATGELAPRPAPVEAPSEPELPMLASVLLVEDEGAVRQLLHQLLQDEGYHVLAAASAEEAEDLAHDAECEIDLLISDVVLPGRSGPDLLARLRHERPGLSVLFLSGYTPDRLRRDDMRVELASCLAKPFGLRTFLGRVRETLARSPKARQATRPLT